MSATVKEAVLQIMRAEPARSWTFLDVALRVKGAGTQAVAEAMTALLDLRLIHSQMSCDGIYSFTATQESGKPN